MNTPVYLNGVEYVVASPKFEFVMEHGCQRYDGGMKRVLPCPIPGHENCGHPMLVTDFAFSIEECIEKGWLVPATHSPD